MNTLIKSEKQIPHLDPHSHGSNLLELSNGDLLCTWFSGTNEGEKDIKIVVSRYDINHETWSVPKYITTDNTRSEQNPLLFYNTNGDIWVVYTSQKGIHQNSSIVKYSVSKDEGLSWNESKVLFKSEGTFVRNPPVIFEDGLIVLPAYYSMKSETGLFGDDYSVVKLSWDHGENWKEVKISQSEGLVHLSLVKVSDNKLVGFFRSRRADNIYRTESKDRGKTWTKPVKTKLLNNNSSVQAKYINNRIFILFNNIDAKTRPPKKNMPPWFREEDLTEAGVDISKTTDTIWGTVRNPLTLAVSEDDGFEWKMIGDIQTSVEDEGEDEYSYPSLIKTNKGDIHITYTFQRKFIKHLILKGEEIS